MADWYGNRHNERYTYKRVSWIDWTEHEEYPFITSGSLELSSTSELAVTGTFDFEGMELPNTSDLMRIYYDFDDDNGEHVQRVLATLFVEYAGLKHYDTVKGVKSKGSLEGSSVLKVLQDKIYGAPFTVTRNTNAIYKAQELIRSCGLQVSYTPSITAIGADHTFDSDATYLDIVNWLCEAANYTPAYPDAMGVVVLAPYGSILRQDSVATFKNDDNSIMYPELDEANDWQKTPNVVKLFYNTDQACIIAQARNHSGSRVSLDARNQREQTYYEEVGELPDNKSKLTSLMDMAEDILRKKSCDIEYVTFEHAYIPVIPYQTITVEYANMTWTGTIDDTSVSLEPSTKAQTKLKRELYTDVIVTKSGEVLRGLDDETNA